MRVECSELAIGMYICELDRPWLDSPFLLQGFYIKDPDDIDTVQEICDYVYIDKLVEREHLNSSLPGASSAVITSMQTTRPASARGGVRLSRAADESGPKAAKKTEQSIGEFFPDRELTQYEDSESWRGEIRNARQAITYLYKFIVPFMDLSSKRKRVDLLNLSKAVEPMIDSIIRNADACLWWTIMKPAGRPHDDAALRASVFSVVVGRRLGLPREDLFALAIGGLLFDVGKLRLDDGILLADRKLTEEEIAYVQTHVDVGLKLLKESGLSDPDIIDYIAYHHERMDGSGYPQGTHGDAIPAFGRIAGLVDCYNAITSSRRHARMKSPAEAINQLYKLKSVHFHKDLIEEFIQAIGVYPVGALVELSTGEVAIVVAQSRTRRLRPVIMMLRNADKLPVPAGRYVQLEKTTHADNGEKLDIVKNLDPDAYGIDIADIRLK